MVKLLETLGLKGAQGPAAAARGRDISLAAGAGCGKTKALVARYLSLLEEGYAPRAVAAVTFTDKAAREMRNRIRSAIHTWREGDCPPPERPRWQEIEADIDSARIGTIHGLCTAILRAHPAEACVDPRFSVLDEGMAATLQAQAVDDTLAWALDQPELADLFRVFETGALADILAFLLDHRLEAMTALQIADVASVWSHVLEGAIQTYVCNEEVQASISTLRALSASGDLAKDAGELLAGQVEGLLAEWARLDKALAGGNCLQAAQILYTIRREYCGGQAGKKSSQAKGAVAALKAQYDDTLQPWIGGKSTKDAPPDPAIEASALNAVSCLGALFQHACQEYQKSKDLTQSLDFDDLEAGALALLQDAAVRARWQGQIQAVLVDEFQDTNERQRQIVEALAGTLDGKAGRLFVVGDAKQSIYRFRGADVTVFRRLDKDIQARGGVPLALDLTFRAHDALICALNEILRHIMGQVQVADQPYRVPFAELQAERAGARDGIRDPFVEFLFGLGEPVEQAAQAAAALLAQRLCQLQAEERVRWDEIALLFRASTGFTHYETALEEAGIPFVTVAGRGFYERPEVRDLLNILRALADPWDDLAMAGLLRSPAFGLSDAALYLLRRPNGNGPVSYWTALTGDVSHLSEIDRRQAERARGIVERWSGVVDRIPVAELLKAVLDDTCYLALLAAEGNGTRLQRNVSKLLADAHSSGLVGVGEFLEYLETRQAAGAREGEAPTEAGGAVRLMTVHKAKGLEFPVVVIADAARARPPNKESVLLSTEIGLAPRSRRQERAPLIFKLAQEMEKERSEAEDVRLLYVAATRAKEKLIICGHQRDKGNDTWMARLAEAVGLNLAELADKPGEWHTITLPESGQVVRAMSRASANAAGSEMPAEPPKTAATSQEVNFYEPLAVRSWEDVDEKLENRRPTRALVQRVTGRLRADGTVLGTCVHAGLARWWFPGDARLDDLLQSVALGEGLVQPEQAELTVQEARELLSRFRAEPRWAEIDGSPERRHEVPYSLSTSDGLSTGYIDLLYRDRAGCWHIVEFKTEAATSDLDIELMLKGKQGKQVRRYLGAVHHLLGGDVDAVLCLLNYNGNVRWVPVA